MNQKSIGVSVHTFIMPYCQLLVILNIVFLKFIMPGIQNICHGDGAPPHIFTYVTWYIYLLNLYLQFILIRNVYIHLLSIWNDPCGGFISSTKIHIKITLNPFRNIFYISKVHLLKTIYNILSHIYEHLVYYSGRLLQCHSANSPLLRSYTATENLPFLPIIIGRAIPVTGMWIFFICILYSISSFFSTNI